MASFIKASLRLLLKRTPREGQMSEEQAQNIAGRIHPDSTVMSSTLGGGSQFPGVDRQIIHDEEKLTLFRLMLGIQTSPYLGFTISSPYGTRPAANIGLYARVVHKEQDSKDRFKVWSLVINACYFLQIVIAAALTALGAAGASRGAVTTFGAINTIIAGLLTFLKGTGLPGRLKYYGNEWKRLREYIEQRERDFMRPNNNNLNVYECVDTIERMYNKLKEDIELNTPDAYTSLTNQRGHSSPGDEKDHSAGGFDIAKLQAIANKIPGMHGKLDNLTDGLSRKADGLTANMHEQRQKLGDAAQQTQHSVAGGLQAHKENLDREVNEKQSQALEALEGGKRVAQELNDQADGRKAAIMGAATEYHTQARGALDDGKQAARDRANVYKTAISDAADEYHTQAREILDDGKQTAQTASDQIDSQRTTLAEAARDYHAQTYAVIDDGHQAVKDQVESHQAVVANTAHEVRAEAVRTISDTRHAAQEQIEATSSHAASSVAQLLKEISDIHKTAVGSGREAAAARIRQLSDRLHHEGHEGKI